MVRPLESDNVRTTSMKAEIKSCHILEVPRLMSKCVLVSREQDVRAKKKSRDTVYEI